jgi:hypothetical protein
MTVMRAGTLLIDFLELETALRFLGRLGQSDNTNGGG